MRGWSPKNFAGFDKSFNDCIPRLQYVATTTRLSDISKFGKRTPIGEMLSGVLTAILEKSPKYQEFRKAFEELFSSDGSDVRVALGSLAEKVKGHLQQQFPDCSKVAFGVGEPAFDDPFEYQPDFVAEAEGMIYMLEPKAANEMEDPSVLAKKEVAVAWCKNASDHAKEHGGKPWRYVLIPHNEIADNRTLHGLVARFGVESVPA